jgi:hypothetical protein
MCLKLKKNNTSPSILANLIDDDFGIAFELSLNLVSNIRRDMCGVSNSFLSF